MSLLCTLGIHKYGKVQVVPASDPSIMVQVGAWYVSLNPASCTLKKKTCARCGLEHYIVPFSLEGIGG